MYKVMRILDNMQEIIIQTHRNQITNKTRTKYYVDYCYRSKHIRFYGLEYSTVLNQIEKA